MDNTQHQLHVDCFNPATGKNIGHSVQHTEEDLKHKLEMARKAQKDWAHLPVAIRVQYFRSVRNYIVENADHLAETIAHDNGKTRMDALATEVLPAAMAISYYCSHAEKFLKEKRITFGNIVLINKRSRLRRVPFGVIAIISPWNYPFSIAFSDIIMALLAGNAVIFKAATETQKTGLAIKHAIYQSQIPRGLFNYINMPGKQAGEALLNAGVDKLFFTGSVATGKYLMQQAGKTLTPVTLELGGNDPMIVCNDADPFRAAAGAVWAGFQNAGQSCGGVERIYVLKGIYREFMNELKKQTEALRIGFDEDFNIDMGVMTVQKQIDIVNAHVEDAIAKGATVFARSRLPEDTAVNNLLPAIVLADANHDMRVMQEETFGPVMAVMKVDDEEEAIRLANDSNLGLTGSVWSRNRKKAKHLARRIEAGVVTINDHLMSHGMAETAWGGFKQSGIGRTHGRLGFEEMTQSQYIIDDILPFVKKDLWWYPFSEATYQGIKGVIDMLYGLSWEKRFMGIGKVLKIIPRIFSRN